MRTQCDDHLISLEVLELYSMLIFFKNKSEFVFCSTYNMVQWWLCRYYALYLDITLGKNNQRKLVLGSKKVLFVTGF